MPNWGADLSGIDFENIYYYMKPTENQGNTWDDVPADIKQTFDRLGIPEAEKKYLAGVGAQYESEVVYHGSRRTLERRASSSSTPTRPCASTRTWSASTSPRSSR